MQRRNRVTPGNSVVVSAQYTYSFIRPLGDIVSFVSGGSLDDC